MISVLPIYRRHLLYSVQSVGVNVRERSPLQALLEAGSTAERLRMVLLRLRELKQKLKGQTRPK